MLAVALNDGETHVATVALAAAGPANGPDDTTDAPPERPTPSPAPELPEFATPGASDGTTPTVGVPSFGAANGLAGISSAAAGFEGVPGDPRPLELLHDVEMAVTAELGRARMTVRELLSLTPGAVVELDRAAGSAVDLLVNGKLIARGEVVVVDDEFGVRISEIVGREDAARRR